MSTALKLKILLLNILGAQLFFLQLGIRQHMAQKHSKSKQIHIQTTTPKPVIKSCKLKCRINKISSVNV
jgi:hypothetical protein